MCDVRRPSNSRRLAIVVSVLEIEILRFAIFVVSRRPREICILFEITEKFSSVANLLARLLTDQCSETKLIASNGDNNERMKGLEQEDEHWRYKI